MSTPTTTVAKERIIHIRFEKEFGSDKEKISADCYFECDYHPSYKCTFSKKTTLKNISEFVVDIFNSTTIRAGMLILKINDQEIRVKKPDGYSDKDADNTPEYYFNLIASNLIV